MGSYSSIDGIGLRQDDALVGTCLFLRTPNFYHTSTVATNGVEAVSTRPVIHDECG
jgi:hypothetical protein